MKYDACSDAIERLRVPLEILVHVVQGHFLMPHNILTDLGYAEATFIIGPLFAIELYDMGVDECLFDTRPVRVFVLLVLVQVPEDLGRIRDKDPYIPAYLRSGQSYPAA